MVKLEKDIEARLRREVERLGGMCLKWVCPGWAGVPDRIILMPGGKVVFVETKRPGGSTRKRQEWWRDKLLRMGYPHYWVFDDTDVDDLMARIITGCTGYEN